jgi:transposase InsO family protein
METTSQLVSQAKRFLSEVAEGVKQTTGISKQLALDFYNGRRPHSSLDGTTPDQAYFTQLPIRLAA